MKLGETEMMKRDCKLRLENVINSGLKVMVYVGMNDLACCSICTANWVDKLRIKQ